MSSVTARIKAVKQPRGGYIKPSMFESIQFDDENVLFSNENVHASIVGMVVDYMTRFLMTSDVNDAFSISRQGAANAEHFGVKGSVVEVDMYLSNIKGLDDISIINACKAVTFDVWMRNPIMAISAKRACDTNADVTTIANIRTMIQRGLTFWNKYGPITVDGFTFEHGYTDTVDSGDGDFLTADTLWDYKVSKTGLKNTHTLQLLMYYIMGKHSCKPEFDNITKIGVFNPRLNIAYVLDVKKIPSDVITVVEHDVIGY